MNKKFFQTLFRKKFRRWLNDNILSIFDLSIKDSKPERANRDINKHDFEDEARKHYAVVKNYTMVNIPRFISLYQQVRYIEVNGIPGDFVECGVWKGGTAGMMALAQMEYGKKKRKLHLFDSFAGLPQATEKDSNVDKKRFGIRDTKDKLESSGELAADDTFVKELLFNQIKYPEEMTYIYKGWFQDTVPSAVKDIPQIALLRLDGDLYESTKICLEYLWDKVVPRGVIVIDDYKSYEGCEKAIAEFYETLEFKPLLSHIESGGARYLIKG